MLTHCSAGILLPISALPGPLGIGDIGNSARKFIDFLAQSHQSYWQICPIGHINHLNSPYICYSAFAGNPYFIDLQLLEKERYLPRSAVNKCLAQHGPIRGQRINYAQIRSLYRQVLELAFAHFQRHPSQSQYDSYQLFCQKHAHWLDDYALFMACTDLFKKSLEFWPTPIQQRTSKGIRHYRSLLAKERDFYLFVQFLFFRQWGQLKSYAHQKKIKIIGDIPIFHAYHSADLWANPDEYWLDHTLRPTHVAGVPPDFFSSTGQLWGNPLYRWEKMQHNRPRYRWWRQVFHHLVECYDCTRIDHFRGFLAYWKIPAQAPNAIQGHWEAAPGEDFFNFLAADHPNLPFLVEDLGVITPDVIALREKWKLPGMNILQFAFGLEAESIAPHQFAPNSVTYTGTHDNDTSWSWFCHLPRNERRKVLAYLQLPLKTTKKSLFLSHFLALAHSGASRLTIIPLQDYLGIGSEGRINTPGVFEKIYTYRIEDRALTGSLAARIGEFTNLYGRRWVGR